MNWRLIFLYSLLSIVLALASVAGAVERHEWVYWLAMGAFCAWQFAGNVQKNFFQHGLYLGIVDGIFNSAIKAVFFSSYIFHNPHMTDAFASLPQDLSPPLVLLVMGPLMGAVAGVVFGLLTVLSALIRKRKLPLDT